MIDSLHKLTVATVGAVIPRGKRVALLDFPRHENVGDSAIWLGEISCLAENGIPLRKIGYMCDVTSYDEPSLRRAVGKDGVILMHGGGNLGDLWPVHQRLREQVIVAFPDNPIILLPQTVHFEQRAALDRATRIFNAHPCVTILARDMVSLDLLRSEFRAHSELCPDAAFCMGAIPRRADPDRDVIYMARTDKEAPPVSGALLDTASCDWPGAGRVWHALDALARIEADHPRAARTFRPTPIRYNLMARARVRSGCRLLEHGRVLVASRLHAHILAILLGIPHILLDNSYGKNRRFHETWTSGSSLTTFAAGPDEAFELAAGVLTGISEAGESRVAR